MRLNCDGTRAETRFRLSTKRTSPFKSAGASVQSTTGSRGVRISGSIAGYAMFRGSVKGTGYALHSPVSLSLLLRASPCAITFRLDSTSSARILKGKETNSSVSFDIPCVPLFFSGCSGNCCSSVKEIQGMDRVSEKVMVAQLVKRYLA